MPSWEDWLAELARRTEMAAMQGGEERIAKQHAKGRLTARERINALLDNDSFQEIGALGGGHPHNGDGIPADGLIGGTGLINGNPVVLMAEDFTVKGGSIGHVGAAKRTHLAKLALQEKRPFVLMLDGAGERAENALERYPRTPNDLQILARMKGQIPIVALILGTSAGHGALGAVFADFVIMTEHASLFTAGPFLVKASLGQDISSEELGGADLHLSESGVAHNRAKDDHEAIRLARRYLQYFSRPHGGKTTYELKKLDRIYDLIPADIMHPYDMAKLLEMVFDEGEILTLQDEFGGSIMTALARLNGISVMIIANQPLNMGGAITKEAAEKAAHFLKVAADFDIPTVFLCDTPGVMPGKEAEAKGTLKAASAFHMAQTHLKAPKFHVTLRKAFGFGSSLMAMNPFDDQTVTLAFPNATLGAMPAGAGAKTSGMEDEAADKLAELQNGAWSGADNVAYDRIIKPEDLRDELIKALLFSRASK